MADFVFIGEFSEISGPTLISSIPRLNKEAEIKSLIGELVNVFPREDGSELSDLHVNDLVFELCPSSSNPSLSAIVCPLSF
jgi:hypothetical protein